MTDAMTDVEVFKASAEACGKEHFEEWGGRLWFNWGYTTAAVWNPFLNADQRWECVRKLREFGNIVLDGDDGLIDGGLSSSRFEYPLHGSGFDEFPARALAELHRRQG